MMRINAHPWTYRPISSVLPGLWRSDTSQSIYPTKALQEPGIMKFTYYWLKQTNMAKVTAENMKLLDLQELLIDKLFVQTGITHESVNYENDAKSMTLVELDGIDKAKAYEEYVKKLPILPEGTVGRELVFGKQALFETCLKHYQKYNSMHRFDLGIIHPNYTLNTQTFCQKLNEYLQNKAENVEVLYSTEVESFLFDEKN